MQKTEVRPLTVGEIGAIPQCISLGLDLKRIEIHDRKWTFLTPGNVTVARGYKIYWPGAPNEAKTLPYLAHLVHEIVHIWQYNILNVGLYSPRWLDRRYGYELYFGDRFESFGLEQQASIVEDAFIVSYGYAPRRARNHVNRDIYNTIMEQIAAVT